MYEDFKYVLTWRINLVSLSLCLPYHKITKILKCFLKFCFRFWLNFLIYQAYLHSAASPESALGCFLFLFPSYSWPKMEAPCSSPHLPNSSLWSSIKKKNLWTSSQFPIIFCFPHNLYLKWLSCPKRTEN